MLGIRLLKTMALALLGCIPFAQVHAVELIKNGSFETGDFTGWTSMNQATSSGQWLIYSNTLPLNDPLPYAMISFYPQPDGTYGAVTDQFDPTTSILYQNVSIPPNSTVTLQFSYAYINLNGVAVIPSPDTLDFTMGPNQQFRIDIMVENPSDPLSILPGDVLQNLVQIQDTDPDTIPYVPVSFDLTPFAGQTIGLRFAIAVTQAPINLGIDGVSIIATPLAPNPPSNLRTCAKSNRFLSQSERIVSLNWDASPSASVVAYRVYKNGTLIATVQGLCYKDHNVCGNNGYQLTAIDNEGHESAAI